MLFPFPLVLSGDTTEAFCEVRQTQEFLWRNKRERDKEKREQILKTEHRLYFVFSPTEDEENK